jgi:ABC-type oligopeptide transport system substrate-binding subunit
MNRGRKIILSVLGLVVLVLVLALSRGKDNSPYFGSTTAQGNSRLNYNILAEPPSIDPQIPNDNNSNIVSDAMFDGLTEYHPQTLEPIAAIATHYEANPDSTQFTFYLRGHKSPKGVRLPNRDDLRQQFVDGKLKTDFNHGHSAAPDDVPAHWSDGTVVTASDFVYSWQRAVNPATAAANADQFKYIKNASRITAKSQRFRDKQTGEFVHGKLDPAGNIQEDPVGPVITASASAMRKTPDRFVQILKRADPVPFKPEELGVRAIDDFTFQVDLIQPTSFFLKMTPMSIFRAVPKQAIERVKNSSGNSSDWLKPENIVVSGAFKLTENLPYDHIKVVKNLQYWDAASVDLKEINFLPIEDRVTGLSLYKAGDIDFCIGGAVPQSFIQQYRGVKQDFIVGPATSAVFYVFQTTNKPFDDLRVRRALDLAVDKQAIADSKRNGQIGQWRLTPTFPGYSPQYTSHYDPAQAKRLLAEAGYPNGTNSAGQKLHVPILFPTNDGLKQTGELLKSFWEENLGIEVELQNQEAKVYTQALSQGRFDGMIFVNFSADYMDPDTYLEIFLSNSPLNGGWKSAKYDDLVNSANAEIDPAKHLQLLADAEDFLMQNQVFVPVYIGVWSYVKKPYVMGVENNLFDKHPLRFMWIDPQWQNHLPVSGRS